MNKIAIIGLEYVGLPLSGLFTTKYQVVGFDNNQKQIKELCSGADSTLEVSDEVLQKVLVNEFKNNENSLLSSSTLDDIADCNYYIVTVPTLVDKNNRPDFKLLDKVGETLRKD